MVGVVFMVLFMIMFMMMMICIVGYVVFGEIDLWDVFVLIGLIVIGYFVVMFVVMLFVLILFVLIWWYWDFEMVVWFVFGVSFMCFIKLIGVFVVLIILLIIFFVFVGWLWLNQQSKMIKVCFQQCDEILLFVLGQFCELVVNYCVFFIEKMLLDQSKVQNVFVMLMENGKVNVVVLQMGYMEILKDGDCFVVFEDGCCYDGMFGQLNFKIMEFECYGVKIMSKFVINVQIINSMFMFDLLCNLMCDNFVEFVWCVGLLLIVINLMVFGILFLYQNLCCSCMINFVMVVLIYFMYLNLLNVVQVQIEQGKMLFGVGFVGLYVIVVVIVVFIFWLCVCNCLLLICVLFGCLGV